MKRLRVSCCIALLIACHPLGAAATERGLSTDDSGAPPGAPAPHIAPPGGGNLPRPLDTNRTPVTGVAPLQEGVPQREVQPGEETPQTEDNTQAIGPLRPPRGGLTKDGGQGGSDPGGSGGSGSGGGGSDGTPTEEPNRNDDKTYVKILPLKAAKEMVQTTVRGVDTPLSTGQGPESGPGDPQSGQAAPPQNPSTNQTTGSTAGALPTRGSSLPAMPTPAGSTQPSGVTLFPDRPTGGARLGGLSRTPPTSAPAGSGNSPATRPGMSPVEIGPGAVVMPRTNCGTYHTGWVDDPEADVNPCPAACERGERLWVESHKSGDKTQYDGTYRCYLPERVVNQRPEIARALEAGGVQGTNCGTIWTQKLDDPDAEANPCPANCERGELVDVRRDRSYDGLQVIYQKNYRCYKAGTMSRVSSTDSSTAAPAGASSAAPSVRPVTGAPQGQRIAGGQSATSTSAVDSAPIANPLRRPAVAEREVSTRNMVPGPALMGVRVDDATTVTAVFQPLPGASVYQVHATANGINHSVTGPEVRQPVLDGGNRPGLPSAMSVILSGLAPGVPHNVWVSVRYPDGRSGASDPRTVTTGPPQNPEGFRAFPVVRPQIPGSVRLEWQIRRGATHYFVEGSNLPRSQTSANEFYVPDIRTAGTHAWTLIAVYPGGVYDDRNAPRASVICAPRQIDQVVTCASNRNP